MEEHLAKITPAQAALFGAAFTAFGLLIGAGVSALTAFLNSYLTRRSEERRQFRQMAIQAGLDNWRHQNQLMIEVIKAGGKGNFVIDAPDSYIIHMLLLMDIASDPKLSPEEATDMIARKSRKPKPENPNAANVA